MRNRVRRFFVVALGLLLGLVVAGVGYFLLRKGLEALKREDLAPRQTIETIKEDQQWAKDQTR